MASHILMGNEAMAYGAVEAGVQVATGYPGTPSSEILSTLGKLSREIGFYVEWSVNEKVALEVAAGAAVAGARSIVTMKQVGLNVAADPLMSLAYLGVKGGMVVVSADDPGPHSSQNEQDTRLFGRFAKLPVLDPATPAEAKEMMREAFGLSERLQMPVILRPTTRVCHACQDVDVAETPYAPVRVPHFEKSLDWVILPRTAAKKHPLLNAKQETLAGLFAESPFNRMQIAGRVGIIAGGLSDNYVREALATLGAEVSLLKIGTPYPLPEKLVVEFLRQVDRVLVVEEQEPVIEEQVVAAAYREGLTLEIVGKRGKFIPREGELNVDKVAEALRRFLNLDAPVTVERPAPPELPLRGPVLCAGCPHRASFYMMRQAVQELGVDAVFNGDIGCYTLGAFPPLEAVDTCLCMGASIGMAVGMQRAEPGRKHIAALGDSTFFHNGIPGLIDAVYNQTDITVVILDNRTTAMTGHQPHPGTGRKAAGDPGEIVDIPALVRACGVQSLAEADPVVPTAALRALKDAISFPGPAVVIMRHTCAALKRGGPRYTIDTSICTDCGTCYRDLGCPAIYLENGHPAILIDKCAGCGFCLRICPSKAIRKVVVPS